MLSPLLLSCSGLLIGRATPRVPVAGRVHMGGGTVQPRRTAPFDPSDWPAAVDSLAAGSSLPQLVVFDLDNTLWTPELYTLRHLPGYATAAPPNPVAGEDVWLIDGAAAALHELATHSRWADTRVAAASRTNKPRWAEALLSDFAVPGVDGERPLSELVGLRQIYPGSKVAHFEALRRDSGVSYDRMLFFDDAAGGKFGNCEPVAALGVLSAHCPRGLTAEVWRAALAEFARRKAADEPMGAVLRAPESSASASASGSTSSGSASGAATVREGDEIEAAVASWQPQKSFGFVRERDDAAGGRGRGRRVFFHRSALADGYLEPKQGDAVRATLGTDRSGRAACLTVAPTKAAAAAGSAAAAAAAAAAAGVGVGGGEGGEMTVRLPAFSMNMPFAGLVAHGHKSMVKWPSW